MFPVSQTVNLSRKVDWTYDKLSDNSRSLLSD
jgi:hypothetical protein